MKKFMNRLIRKIRASFRRNPKMWITGLIIIAIVMIIGAIYTYIQLDHKKQLQEKEPIVEPAPNEVLEKKVQIIDLESNSRNIAVMINNIKTVWGYQTGLQDAYLVYEMIVEGGYTRLMAVYKDKDTERIGSVRSSRPYYLDYALENDALYIHFGGSDQALADIPNLGIQNINFLSSQGYWRDKSIKLATEHTAYTSMEKIKEQISKRGYRTTTESSPILNYVPDEMELSAFENSQVANKILIEYSGSKNTSFEYDSEKKVYKRFQNGIEHKDYLTKEQYTTKNILVYQVENYNLDNYGRQALNNIGKGNGYYISNGYAIGITWEKSSRGGKTIYKYLNGTELKINDGNTHVEIQPMNKRLTIE